MIISFNIDPADVALLDKLAGPRGRSAWLRRVIAAEYARLQRKQEASRPLRPGEDIRLDGRNTITVSSKLITGRKATTPRKKAA